MNAQATSATRTTQADDLLAPLREHPGRNALAEVKMAKYAINRFEELCRATGMETLGKHDRPFPPGYSIHELSTCHMGDDPKKSVLNNLNNWNQSHDINNLFMDDGSNFVNDGYQNPTYDDSVAIDACLRMSGQAVAHSEVMK